MQSVLDLTGGFIIMAKRDAYLLVFAEAVKEHLRAIDAKYHSFIQAKIEEQLRYDALVETRNRKPLRRAILGAEWELRFGPQNRFRAYYRVITNEQKVSVLAVGVKERNRLLIAGEEIVG